MTPILYIRMPKTGSSSFIESILMSDITCVIIKEQNYTEYHTSQILIIASEFYKKHIDHFEKIYKNHIKIAMVRNPYSKFLSAKNYCSTTKKKTNTDVLKSLPTKKQNIHDWGHLTRTQTDGLIYNGKKQYDMLFYYEQYNEIIKFISNHFSVPISETRKNITDKYDTNLTIHEKGLINNIYELDFKNFYT